MFQAILLSLLASSVLSLEANNANIDTINLEDNIFNVINSNGHEAKITKNNKNKWITFPKQKELHMAMRENSRNIFKSNIPLTKIISEHKFFDEHKEALGLDSSVKLIKRQEHYSANIASNIVTVKYDQFVHNYRVYGGEFVLLVSNEHKGVLNAHGLPFKSDLMKKYDDMNVIHQKIKHVKSKDIHDIVFNHIDENNKKNKINNKNNEIINFKTNNNYEVVWHMSDMINGNQGHSVLSYHVKGSYLSNNNGKTFDAFVNVENHEILQYVDSTNKISPFKEPLNAKFLVFDNGLNDFNDDVTDDVFYNPDPDRYSMETLVFSNLKNTPSKIKHYPTSNAGLNNIIDNSLYTKNLMQGLTGMQSWNGSKTNLIIEYNITMDNAYFDGYMGIHFGNGLNIDDVTAHEWAHGYTQTLSDLFYFGQSGAMNEAFSDIIGETIDLLNNHVKKQPKNPLEDQLRNAAYPSCEQFDARWRIGEDYNNNGFRDMYWPQCFYDPDTIYSPYVICDENVDNMGVHFNSGIINRIYSVLVDGGQYQKVAPDGTVEMGVINVKGVGMDKALRLMVHSNAALTSTSQFSDLAIAMKELCELHIGDKVTKLDILTSESKKSNKVTSKDCKQVENVIRGSGIMYGQNMCHNRRMLKENDKILEMKKNKHIPF